MAAVVLILLNLPSPIEAPTTTWQLGFNPPTFLFAPLSPADELAGKLL
jgi:hypothetical protein